MGLPFLAGAQSATVHIYRTGNPRGKLHVKMDGHDLFLLQDGHAATLAVQPGDHEFWVGFEGIGSGSTPVAVSIVHARQGSEAFLHVDYQFAFGKAMMGGGATSMHLAMQEEPGMPPDLKRATPGREGTRGGRQLPSDREQTEGRTGVPSGCVPHRFSGGFRDPAGVARSESEWDRALPERRADRNRLRPSR
jgi:hypothetical protein